MAATTISTLAVTSSCNSIVQETLSSGVIVSELVFSLLHPGVNHLQGFVKVVKAGNKFINFVNLFLESGNNFKFVLDCLDFLLDKVFFVFGESHGHDIVIVLDFTKHTFDGVLGIVEDSLPLGQIIFSSIEVKAFLDLLDFFFTLLKFDDNGLESGGIAFPGSFGVVQKLQTSRGLVLGFIPN